MKSISIKPDTPMKRYLTVASALLLLFTVWLPPLGISFAAGNGLFFVLKAILRKKATGNKKFWWNVALCGALSNISLFLYFSLVPTSGEAAKPYLETVAMGNLMQESMPEFFKALFYSVGSGNGSGLSAVLTAPLLNLLGGSYPVYVLLNFNLYLLPALIVLGLLVREFHKALVPLGFLFFGFSAPLLNGSGDCMVLLSVSLWMLLIYKQTFRKRAKKDAVLLGVLLGITGLLCSSFILLVFGVSLALLASVWIRCLYDKKYEAKWRISNHRITFLVFLCITALPIVSSLRTVVEGWSGFGLVSQNAALCLAYYGGIMLAVFLSGCAGLRLRHFRQFTSFLLLSVAFVFLLFASMVPFTVLQQCLLAPFFFLLAVIGVFSLVQDKKKAVAILYVLMAASLFVSMVPMDLPRGILPCIFPTI